MLELNFSADCAFKQLDAAGGVINPFIISVSHVWESLLWLLLDKANGVVVRIADIHLTSAPGLVHRLHADLYSFCDQFSAQRVHVLNQEIHYPACNAITRKRRHMHPDALARKSHVAGIRQLLVGAVRKLTPKAEPSGIEGFGGSCVRDVYERNR